MKVLTFSLLFASAKASAVVTTDAIPVSYVYNCLGLKQDVNEVNALIGDGTCNPETNCRPFQYDLGDCMVSGTCTDEGVWFEHGRENFRCSTKTGGERFKENAGKTWVDACDCYEFCQSSAMAEMVNLTAFDMYTGKCRCWSGTCDDENSLPCRDGRCPSEIYYPKPTYDCDGNDISYYWGTLQQYLGDGFCDGDDWYTPFLNYPGVVFNFNCPMFNYDDGDCVLNCHTDVYWETNFVDLDDSFERVDESDAGNQLIGSTNFTTACECYEYCADIVNDVNTDFTFDHDHAGHCRCWDGTSVSTYFCGLDTDCQVYYPNRKSTCGANSNPEEDQTLGVYSSGMFGTVQSWDSYLQENCEIDGMCEKNSYSQGSCADCDRFSSDKHSYKRCDTSSTLQFSISQASLTAFSDSNSLSCRCLSYCFDVYAEMIGDIDDTYATLSDIAIHNFAYELRQGNCNCLSGCDTLINCNSANCNNGDAVYYTTVADLNQQV